MPRGSWLFSQILFDVTSRIGEILLLSFYTFSGITSTAYMMVLNFLKSTRPSLPLKKAPPLISVFSPQARRRKPPSGARNRYALRSADHQRSRHVVRDGTALIRCFLCLILRLILYESEESKDKLNMLLSSH